MFIKFSNLFNQRWEVDPYQKTRALVRKPISPLVVRPEHTYKPVRKAQFQMRDMEQIQDLVPFKEDGKECSIETGYWNYFLEEYLGIWTRSFTADVFYQCKTLRGKPFLS